MRIRLSFLVPSSEFRKRLRGVVFPLIAFRNNSEQYSFQKLFDSLNRMKARQVSQEFNKRKLLLISFNASCVNTLA